LTVKIFTIFIVTNALLEIEMDLKKIKEEARRTALEKKYPYRIVFLSRISPYVTYLFAKTSVTPNQLTLLGFVFAMLGAISLSGPRPLDWIVGWLLLQVYLILDCCDGELARIKGMETRFGVFIDNFLHPISNALVVIGVGVGCYQAYNSPSMLFLTAATSAVTVALSLSRSNMLLLARNCGLPTESKGRHPLLWLFLSPGGFFHPILLLALAEISIPMAPFRMIYIPSVLVSGIGRLMIRVVSFYRGLGDASN